LGNDHEIFAVEGLVFEKVDQFKYFGATIKSNNDWSVEIVIHGEDQLTSKKIYATLTKYADW